MEFDDRPSDKHAEFQLLSLFLKKTKEENLALSETINGYKLAINILTEQLSKKSETLNSYYQSRIKKEVVQLVEEYCKKKAGADVNIEDLKASLDRLFDEDQSASPVLNNKTLSMSEKRIAEMLKSGARAKDIAAQLGISWHTAQTHIKNIRKKLCLTGRPVQTGKYLSETSN